MKKARTRPTRLDCRPRKGLAILEGVRQPACAHDAHPGRRAAGLRARSRAALLTLESLGYVYTDGKLYGLTPRVLRVGWSYFDSARLPRTVQPYLQQLSASLNESAYVSVLDDWELVFIARNGVSRVMTTGFVLGARVPAPLTSPGVVLLAHHPDREAVRVARRHRTAAVHAAHDHQQGAPARTGRSGTRRRFRGDRTAIAGGRARNRGAAEEPSW